MNIANNFFLTHRRVYRRTATPSLLPQRRRRSVPIHKEVWIRSIHRAMTLFLHFLPESFRIRGSNALDSPEQLRTSYCECAVVSRMRNATRSKAARGTRKISVPYSEIPRFGSE